MAPIYKADDVQKASTKADYVFENKKLKQYNYNLVKKIIKEELSKGSK